MAIIKSVVLEEASGSIDGLVFYQLNGQQVVRSKAVDPYDPKTPAQLAQRAKIANMVFLYSYMSDFVQFRKAEKTQRESLYNLFGRIYTSSLNLPATKDFNTLLVYLKDKSFGTSNFIEITSIGDARGSYKTRFNTLGIPWASGHSLIYGGKIVNEQSFYQYSRLITEAEWNQGWVINPNSDYIVQPRQIYFYNIELGRYSNIKS